MAIDIEINADLKNAIKAFKNGEISLDDLEKKLDDSGSAGKEAGKDIEEGSKDAGDGLDEVADKSGKTGDALKGLGGAAKSALDGDVGGAVSSAVDAVSGLTSIIPGVGGLIGAGIGTALSEGVKLFTADLDAQAKASEDRVQGMFDAFIESGLNYYTESQKIDAIGAIFGDKDALKRARDDAQELGVSVAEVVAAQVEGGEKRAAILQRIDDLKQAEYDVGLKGGEIDSNRIVALNKIKDELEGLTAEQTDATLQAEQYRDAVGVATGNQQMTSEELRIQNSIVANRPTETVTKLTVDDSALQIATQPRTVRVNLIDQYGRGVK